jgi:hypothetical protein
MESAVTSFPKYSVVILFRYFAGLCNGQSSGNHGPNGVAMIISIFCIALLCIVMGRRKPIDPRDYRSVDLEAPSDDVPMRGQSSGMSRASVFVI